MAHCFSCEIRVSKIRFLDIFPNSSWQSLVLIFHCLMVPKTNESFMPHFDVKPLAHVSEVMKVRNRGANIFTHFDVSTREYQIFTSTILLVNISICV